MQRCSLSCSVFHITYLFRSQKHHLLLQLATKISITGSKGPEFAAWRGDFFKKNFKHISKSNQKRRSLATEADKAFILLGLIEVKQKLQIFVDDEVGSPVHGLTIHIYVGRLPNGFLLVY